MPEGTGQLQESSVARRSVYYNRIIALLLCVCAAEVGVLITLPLIQRRLKRPDQQTRWTARTLMMFEKLAAVTQRLLEHSSPNLTNKVYMNVDPVLRDAVEQLPIGDWL